MIMPETKPTLNRRCTRHVQESSRSRRAAQGIRPARVLGSDQRAEGDYQGCEMQSAGMPPAALPTRLAERNRSERQAKAAECDNGPASPTSHSGEKDWHQGEPYPHGEPSNESASAEPVVASSQSVQVMTELATSTWLESTRQIALPPPHCPVRNRSIGATVSQPFEQCAIVNLRRVRDSGLLPDEADSGMGDAENDRTGGYCCVVADPAGVRSLRFASLQARGAHLVQRGQILRREIFGTSG